MYTVFVGKTVEGDLGVDGMILKQILKERERMTDRGLELYGLGCGQLVSSCQHFEELPVCINAENLLTS